MLSLLRCRFHSSDEVPFTPQIPGHIARRHRAFFVHRAIHGVQPRNFNSFRHLDRTQAYPCGYGVPAHMVYAPVAAHLVGNGICAFADDCGPGTP